MCKEVLDYKNEHNNDFSNYFNLKDIDKDAENLLKEFYENSEYALNKKSAATQIIEIAKFMGFSVFTAKFADRNLSGTIGISEKLKQKYNNNKVIILNNEDTDEHILFTLAHEIAHYIYDYNHESLGYSNTYRTNEAQTDSEKRANRFAAALLMPKDKFTKEYMSNQDIKHLSSLFKVPETAVKVRIQELELCYG